MIVARYRKCRDLVGEGKMFVKNTAEVPSGVGCSERGVVYLRKLLLFKSNEKKFSFRRVQSKKIGKGPDISPWHFPLRHIPPGHFPRPDIPPPFLHGVGHSSLPPPPCANLYKAIYR